MRKQDIKPGVLYAEWREQNAAYSTPSPIVFLAALGDVLWRRPRRSRSGEPTFCRAQNYDKPKRNTDPWTGPGDVGYPVATPGGNAADPETLLAVTLADFESATSEYGDNANFKVLTSLTGIWGPWDEAIARHAELEAARQAERDRKDARQEAGKAAAQALSDALCCDARWDGQHVVLAAMSAARVAAELRTGHIIRKPDTGGQ